MNALSPALRKCFLLTSCVLTPLLLLLQPATVWAQNNNAPTSQCIDRATEAPGIPPNLRGSFGPNGATLSWSAPEGGAYGYEISRHVHYPSGSGVQETGGIVTLGYGSTAQTGRLSSILPP